MTPQEIFKEIVRELQLTLTDISVSLFLILAIGGFVFYKAYLGPSLEKARRDREFTSFWTAYHWIEPWESELLIRVAEKHGIRPGFLAYLTPSQYLHFREFLRETVRSEKKVPDQGGADVWLLDLEARLFPEGMDAEDEHAGHAAPPPHSVS